MLHGVESLRKIGHPIYKKTDSEIEFLNVKVSMVLESANDEWEFRLHARLRGLALNAKLLDLLPWEKWMLTPGEMPNMALFAHVPNELLANNKVCRQAAVDF